MAKEKIAAIHGEISAVFNQEKTEKPNTQKPNENSINSNEPSNLLEELNLNQPKITKIRDEVLLKFELTGFIISNRPSFSICENLLEFLKKFLTDFDSQKLLQTSISRKMATETAKLVLVKPYKKIFLKNSNTLLFH